MVFASFDFESTDESLAGASKEVRPSLYLHNTWTCTSILKARFRVATPLFEMAYRNLLVHPAFALIAEINP
jgi:hypothetical protein